MASSVFAPFTSYANTPNLTDMSFSVKAPTAIGSTTTSQQMIPWTAAQLQAAQQAAGTTNIGTYGNENYIGGWTQPQAIPGALGTRQNFIPILPLNKTVSNQSFAYTNPANITAAGQYQLDKLASARSAVDQYANPNLYWTAPTPPEMVQPLTNTYTQARGAFNNVETNINDIVRQFSQETNLFPNQSQLNSSLVNAYQQAQSRYNPNALNENIGPNTGMTDIGQMYGAARQNFMPYLQVGQGSLGQLQALTGGQGADAEQAAVNAIMNSPEVQAQVNTGTGAIGRLAAAKGYLRSGRVLNEVEQFGQNLAQNAIQQRRDALMSQAGLGTSAAQDIAGLYSGQSQAELAKANQLSALDVNQAKDLFGQQQAINAQNLQARDSQLQALGLQSSTANNIAQLLAQQAQGTLGAQQQQFENTVGASQATAQDQLRARQEYLNNILNILSAEGKVGAETQLGLGQTLGNISNSTAPAFNYPNNSTIANLVSGQGLNLAQITSQAGYVLPQVGFNSQPPQVTQTGQIPPVTQPYSFNPTRNGFVGSSGEAPTVGQAIGGTFNSNGTNPIITDARLVPGPNGLPGDWVQTDSGLIPWDLGNTDISSWNWGGIPFAGVLQNAAAYQGLTRQPVINRLNGQVVGYFGDYVPPQ